MGTKRIDSIEHYERILTWAKKQDPEGYPDPQIMEQEIGENWNGRYCVYCETYREGYCSSCTLYANDSDEEDIISCCGGRWDKMNDSETWAEFVDNVKKMINFIELQG